MPYCMNCGQEITELEVQLHYNRCSSCYEAMHFCRYCEQEITEVELREYNGLCFRCYTNSFLGKPLPNRKLSSSLFGASWLCILLLFNYVFFSFGMHHSLMVIYLLVLDASVVIVVWWMSRRKKKSYGFCKRCGIQLSQRELQQFQYWCVVCYELNLQKPSFRSLNCCLSFAMLITALFLISSISYTIIYGNYDLMISFLFIIGILAALNVIFRYLGRK